MLVTLAKRIPFPAPVAQGGQAYVRSVWLALVAAALMLPRILSPQLGLLDDGVTLRVAESMTSDWRAPIEVMRASGRFMPGYWLFYGMRYAFFGNDPMWLFLSNWMVLVAAAVCLARFVQIASGSARAALLAGLLFVLAGPVVENFYTLSKSEVPQTLGLAASLWLVASVDQARERRTGAGVRSALLFGCILLLLLTKETSVVLVPIGGAWLLLDRVLNRVQGGGTDSRGYAVFFVSGLVALVVFLGLRAYFALPALSQGGYTGGYRLDATVILSSLRRWALFGSRDFLYLVPLLLSAALWLRRASERVRRLVWNMAIWMGGWMAIFLPWPSVLEYHLLPFALGACAMAGVLLSGLVDWAFGSQPSRTGRRVALTCLMATLLSIGISVVNNASNGGVQLAVDAANAKLVDFLATLPRGSAVLVNLPDPNEYVYELRLQLHEMKARPDLAVGHLFPASPAPRPAGPRTFYVTPRMENQPVPSVRLAFWEDGTREWRTALERELASSTSRPTDITQASRLLDVDIPELACETAERVLERHLCSSPRAFVERRELRYGWSVYERP